MNIRNRRFSRAAVRLLPAVTALAVICSCSTLEELPRPQEPAESAAEAAPPAEPESLGIDWAGTSWILPDPAGAPKEFPGYRGFHLGRDGRLRLVNIDSAEGSAWSAAGNRLTLSLEGHPQLPLGGTFLVHPAGGGSGSAAGAIRLVPENDPSGAGVVFVRGAVNVDVIENHWIPMELRGGETVMWPMNREIHLMLLPDVTGMGVLGYGGENRFRGSINLGDERFEVGPISITRRTGPASGFENLYVRCIDEADGYVQVGDDLFLYAGTSPLAAFRVRLFD